MRILHLDTEKTWRGGENQVKALIEGLHEKVEKQFAAAPFNSVAIKENRWSCEALELKSGNPYDPRIIYQLVQFIKKNKIQLIDAHTAKAHTLAVHVALFLPDLKIVVHRRVDNVPKKNFTRNNPARNNPPKNNPPKNNPAQNKGTYPFGATRRRQRRRIGS